MGVEVLKKKNVSLKITIIYFIIGMTWSVFSNSLILPIIADLNVQGKFYNFQQYVFIVFTSFVIYYVIKREIDKNAYKDIVDFNKVDMTESFENGVYEEEFNITKKNEDERKLQLSYQELAAVYEQLAATEEELRAQFDELQENQEQIKKLAYYDTVTNLPNRVLFTDRLDVELAKCKANNSKGMVLFLDLDEFKKVNDTMGHDFGDELLKNIGQILVQCVGENNTVARFGGDEFLVLIPEFDNHMDAKKIADKVLNNFKSSLHIGDKEIYVTPSIGIAIYPDDGSTVQMIIRNVDTAMYAAKGNGKNTFYFFDKDISEAVLRKTEVEKGLRDALKNDELYINYQPQIDIKTGMIHGLEALIRWNSKKLGFVSPMEFIPIAEETGIIKELGEWIIRTACKESKRMKKKGLKFNTISVNVSALQLQQPDFIEKVRSILEEEQLEPHFLEIEITESILMKRLEDNVKRLDELRGIGVKTALDDFGTGYSSLRYLRMLPLDTLKIDKSFIDRICINESDKDITDGIIQLAHKINLDVVIEGVEEKDQVELLKDMRCNLIQGYYFSKPLPIDKMEDLLEKACFKV